MEREKFTDGHALNRMHDTLASPDAFVEITNRYRQDGESVYTTWFLNSADRLKAFRSIRRGVEQVAADIRNGKFGNDFRGTALEFVLSCITEQKQIFEGAAHAFYWKPKLRIPDIYENEANKRAFGTFLENCLASKSEEQLLREILRLADLRIKGLGPAVANILYFLHPEILPPANTAMLNGFNVIFGTKKKLGSWKDYLEMRDVILETNALHRSLFSRDLGAISGLLFEIGSGKLMVPGNTEAVLDIEIKKREALTRRRHEEVREDMAQGQAHTQMQYLLSCMGKALGYAVCVASNDRNRSFNGSRLADVCLPCLPPLNVEEATHDTIALIDVLWLDQSSGRIIAAFEVEKSTSIYSGILRLSDLSMALPDHATRLWLVVPDSRQREVNAQLARPSFSRPGAPKPSYLVFSDLTQNCDAICRFGRGHEALDRIAKWPI